MYAMLETSGAISDAISYILSYILLQFPTDLVVGFDSRPSSRDVIDHVFISVPMSVWI